MKQSASLVCANPKCGKKFPIKSVQIRCDKCNFLLDVGYTDAPSPKLKEVFYERRNPLIFRNSISNTSKSLGLSDRLSIIEYEFRIFFIISRKYSLASLITNSLKQI